MWSEEVFETVGKLMTAGMTAIGPERHGTVMVCPCPAAASSG